jgi:hypothetical protein
MTRTRTRGGSLWLVGLAVALLLAGVVSYYASSSPDGLEFVAEKLGFMDAAADHLAESSPLADYELAGIENERAAVGMAGIVGSLVVLALSFGLFRVLTIRREIADARGPVGGN